ncbi:hypothetical protein I306_05308 [Cryptococcus gattii EJB2]|uniref:Uncharacterized protein n=1 Tax=Cryptococcus gattii EJB2 TaxID=1296103 RepID=A0ABR5BPW6_9TREE|nr:hypothetical protein I306_05308 [Cryptococcus gattii EJB2]
MPPSKTAKSAALKKRLSRRRIIATESDSDDESPVQATAPASSQQSVEEDSSVSAEELGSGGSDSSLTPAPSPIQVKRISAKTQAVPKAKDVEKEEEGDTGDVAASVSDTAKGPATRTGRQTRARTRMSEVGSAENSEAPSTAPTPAPPAEDIDAFAAHKSTGKDLGNISSKKISLKVKVGGATATKITASVEDDIEGEREKPVMKMKNDMEKKNGKRTSGSVDEEGLEDAGLRRAKMKKVGKVKDDTKGTESDDEDEVKPKMDEEKKPTKIKKKSKRIVIDGENEDVASTPDPSMAEITTAPTPKPTSPARALSPVKTSKSNDKPPSSSKAESNSPVVESSTPSVPAPNAASGKPKPKPKAITKLEGTEVSHKKTPSAGSVNGTPQNKLLSAKKTPSGNIKRPSGSTTSTPTNSAPKVKPTALGGSLLAQTLNVLNSKQGKDEKEIAKGKEDKREKERKERGRFGWYDEWVLSASEQKEFDESRAKREAERKKRNAYGANMLNLQGGQDAFRIDNTQPSPAIFDRLDPKEINTRNDLPSQMLQKLLGF